MTGRPARTKPSSPHLRDKYDNQMPTWALTEILELGHLANLYKGLQLGGRIVGLHAPARARPTPNLVQGDNEARSALIELSQQLIAYLPPPRLLSGGTLSSDREVCGADPGDSSTSRPIPQLVRSGPH